MSDECMPEEAVTNFGKQVPMKRPGQPAELATAYVMLADPLSSYAAYYEQGHVVGMGPVQCCGTEGRGSGEKGEGPKCVFRYRRGGALAHLSTQSVRCFTLE